MEKATIPRRSILHLLTERKVIFSIALASGFAAVISVLLMMNAGWAFLTFNSNNFSSLSQQLLSNSSLLASANISASSLASFLNGELSLSLTVQQSLFVFLPLLAIAGAFMVITAFYLKSKNKKVASYGVAFAVIFSLLFFIGTLVYLPIAPSNVSVFFSYLGMFTGNVLEMVAAYVLLFAYVILGLLASVLGFYRLMLSRGNE